MSERLTALRRTLPLHLIMLAGGCLGVLGLKAFDDSFIDDLRDKSESLEYCLGQSEIQSPRAIRVCPGIMEEAGIENANAWRGSLTDIAQVVEAADDASDAIQDARIGLDSALIVGFGTAELVNTLQFSKRYSDELHRLRAQNIQPAR